MVQRRPGERGQTIILVAVSMLVLLALTALAIDVVTLYVSHNEAQRAADAAAMAGAKAFVTSGYTSVPSAFLGTPPCNGSTGVADVQAQASVLQNLVGGVAPTITTSCNLGTPTNPQITVTVQRTGLPVFFSRIWGASSPTATATATAEAYNPSGGPATINASGVKPWLLPNCDPTNTIAPTNANCPPGYSYFVSPVDGSIANNGSFIGQSITLTVGSAAQLSANVAGPPAPNVQFYPLDIPTGTPAPACPATAQPGCTNAPGTYYDNIACFNPTQLSCGQTVGSGGITLDNRINIPGLGGLKNRQDEGTQCLIHSTGANNFPGSCTPGMEQDCFAPQGPGQPILIAPGINNPDPALASASYVSRSDSVVTVPLFDGSNLCASNPCSGSATIVGFLQLGIQQQTGPAGNRDIQAIILNASGCNPGAAGGTMVSGGGVAPVPVRLVQ
jgi:hypothetical protein